MYLDVKRLFLIILKSVCFL